MQCFICNIDIILGVPHPVRWNDTLCRFVGILNAYCSWNCAYVGVKKEKSDHLMGLLNFMFMHYTKKDYGYDLEDDVTNPGYTEGNSITDNVLEDTQLDDFLKYCLPFTQMLDVAEVQMLESIQENKYLRTLYRPAGTKRAIEDGIASAKQRAKLH